MSTVRRVQYGVPGDADSSDPAAGGSKPRVVVTEETDSDADRFEELLDGEATCSSDAEAIAKRREDTKAERLDRYSRVESEEPLDDEAPVDKPEPDEDGPTAAERGREEAAAEAQGTSQGDAEAMLESKQSDEADGLEEASDTSDSDDQRADSTAGSADAGEAGTVAGGVVPTSIGGEERRSAAPPVTSAGHAGEQEHRHDGSSGFDDSDAVAAAAAAAQQAPPVALAGTGMVPPAVDEAPDTAPRAVSEIAQQVAAQLSVRQATPGAAAQVRIQLRDDVLPKTSLMIATEGDTVQVTVTTGSAASAALVEAHAADLAAAIAGRTGKAARIRYRDESGAVCAVEAGLPDAPELGAATP